MARFGPQRHRKIKTKKFFKKGHGSNCNLEGHKVLKDNTEEFLTHCTKLIC